MSETDILFGLSEGAQGELVSQLCFDKCGKILVGGIEFMGGIFFPCAEVSCPFVEKESEIMADIHFGDKNYALKFRKLQSPHPPEAK